MSEFKRLIKRYAGKKQICNCGEAYYENCGVGSVVENGKRVQRSDLPTCRYGCSANIIRAKEYVAKKVLEELS